MLACKRRVVQFVHRWVITIRHPVFEDSHSLAFVEVLNMNAAFMIVTK